MEVITDDTIVFTDDIDLYLHEYYIRFCNDNEKIDEYILQSNQNTWNGCMIYVYNQAIKPKKRYLRQSKNGYFYDFDKVFSLLHSYIYISNLYDKEITITTFCKLSGIAYDTIYEWYYRDKEVFISESVYDGSIVYDHGDNMVSGLEEGNKVRVHSSDIYKILTKERESSLSSKLVSGKVNPVGVLGVLNHAYGWNTQEGSAESGARQSLSASDLPKLEILDDK